MSNALQIQIASVDPRLKRNINHDPRSADYQLDVRGLTPTDTEWKFPGESFYLDQGNYGYCTAEGAHYAMWSEPHFETAKNVNPFGPSAGVGVEEWGLYFYADETANDPYTGTFTYPPPGGQDTGSDGLTSAKRLKALGYIDSYQHTFTADDALLGIQKAPFSWGTLWKEGMDAVDENSGIVRYTGATRGGHQMLAYKTDWKGEWLWVRQSWGGWGYQRSARFKISFDDFALSLKDQGDATFFIPKTAPIPPQPPQPNVDPRDQVLLDAANAWEPGIISHLTKAGRLKIAIDGWKRNHNYV